MRAETIAGTAVLHLPPEGPLLASGQDALDVLGDVWGTHADAEMVVIPAARLAPSFFDLRTGQAGDFLQKLVNYRMRLAVLGDIGPQLAGSSALRDFVRESNQGSQVWFLAGAEELRTRLAAQQRPAE